MDTTEYLHMWTHSNCESSLKTWIAQEKQNTSLEEGRCQESPTLAGELLAPDSYWEREIQFPNDVSPGKLTTGQGRLHLQD